MDVESNRAEAAGPEAGPAGGLADGKAPDALRTIGEVARALNIRQHVLRYWEDQFPLLRPLKRSGGRRYYRPADIELVRTIDRLVHQEGYTLRGARQVLDESCARPGQTRRAGPRPADLAASETASETAAQPTGPVLVAGPVLAGASQIAPEPVLSGLRLLRDRLAAALAAA